MKQTLAQRAPEFPLRLPMALSIRHVSGASRNAADAPQARLAAWLGAGQTVYKSVIL
jgi:hypothetical protein